MSKNNSVYGGTSDSRKSRSFKLSQKPAMLSSMSHTIDDDRSTSTKQHLSNINQTEANGRSLIGQRTSKNESFIAEEQKIKASHVSQNMLQSEELVSKPAGN